MPRRVITWPEHKELLQRRHGATAGKGEPWVSEIPGGYTYNYGFYCSAMAIELALEIHPNAEASRYLQYLIKPPHMFPSGIAASFTYSYRRADAYHREYSHGRWSILSALKWLRYVNDYSIKGEGHDRLNYDPNNDDTEQRDFLYNMDLNGVPTTHPAVLEVIHEQILNLTYEWIREEHDNDRSFTGRMTFDWIAIPYAMWVAYVNNRCKQRLAFADIAEGVEIEMQPPPLLEY